jgi:predicted enzyme related to lactoylglutathione lyase
VSVFNHVGLCVSDLPRARRFYEELLGFTFGWEFEPGDEGTSSLLRIAEPVNLTAVYLVREGFVLELLHYDRDGNPPARERTMNEPGLTHISLSVDDIHDVASRVAEYGGSVLAETDIGAAIMIRDPEGQLIELLPMEYRSMIEQAP